MGSEIGVFFMWMETHPDARQYRQNSCLLVPQSKAENPVKVWIGIPFDAQHVHNYAEIVSAQLDANLPMPEPILTAKGMKVALDRLGEHFVDETSQDDEDTDWGNESDETATSTDVDWSDTTASNKDATSSDADWETGDDKSDEKSDDDKWDDQKEKWDE